MFSLARGIIHTSVLRIAGFVKIKRKSENKKSWPVTYTLAMRDQSQVIIIVKEFIIQA